jgi:hypothetical protein
MTYNNRRKGRQSPPSTEPSRDTLWSQGTHSHSLTHCGTLLGSSSRSATLVSTRVNFCVPIPVVAKPRPRIDDNHKMYFIFPNHVLDIEVIVTSVRNLVRCTVYNLINVQSCSNSSADSQEYVRGNGVEDTGLGNRTYR